MQRYAVDRLKSSLAKPLRTMPLLSSRPMRNYLFGLLCVVAAAWLTAVTGSLLPLSAGGAVLVMVTGPLIRAIRAHFAGRRDTP
jgi:hypothetical protein